ncbi:tRNA pseudouridine(38-40) synthase TruA [Arcobacter sp. FWKO B]|uniref:tRNA pseudouridine(38-40) synthase TruA n=1 Tax=Arcobacter sp. FWKO B TaxID=2593672 RepID=UPI0018A4FA50|nr:tRNA pseudouridine(38-40) synthase TruA [Arcobacter sp. FWKO B]QOG12192.1 tRNA pseudouridine(38-40) synthase TruA [Arcobacter sp. FWKO B]
MNLKVVISYNGEKFYGSQLQPNQITIASCLYDILSSINISTTIHFSGRTDKGVHASYQVISFEISDLWSNRLSHLQNIFNKYLPSGIKVLSIKKVGADFHARYSAKKRAYRYLITTKPTTPFNNDFITYVPTINESVISKAIKEFIGTYDFDFFCKSNPQIKTTTRTIYNVLFYKYKGIYVLKFEANGFLRSQIRIMVGFLLAISDGKVTIDDLKNQLQKKRLVYNKPAPCNGLYLTKVKY